MSGHYTHAQRHTEPLPWCGWCRRLNGLAPLHTKGLRNLVRAVTCRACGAVSSGHYCGACLHLQDSVILALPTPCACSLRPFGLDNVCLWHAQTQDNKEHAA